MCDYYDKFLCEKVNAEKTKPKPNNQKKPTKPPHKKH